MGWLSEKTNSAGLRLEAILSWVLENEFDLDFSVLAFFVILLFLLMVSSFFDLVISKRDDSVASEEVSVEVFWLVR